MSTVKLIDYDKASKTVKSIFDDIKNTRKTEYINNFWKALANQPNNLKRIWDNLKVVMAPGAIEGLTKEMIYIAVSTVNNCDYCIHSHTYSAFQKGMTPEQYEELLAVIAMAQQTNGLANAMKIEVDEVYKK